LFLSLPDEVQEQILQDDEISEETTSEQFRERIAKLNSDEVSEIVTDDVIPGYSESESKVDSLLDDIEGTSKFIQKENNLSKNVIPLIQ
jgi:hypothetical protein